MTYNPEVTGSMFRNIENLHEGEMGKTHSGKKK